MSNFKILRESICKKFVCYLSYLFKFMDNIKKIMKNKSFYT